jgi:DNA-binding transcriptional LysR family regulator
LLFSPSIGIAGNLCKLQCSALSIRKNKMKNSLQHIRAFLCVAHHGNFARAAAELHLSPSALTVQIKQLEEWMEVGLVDRGPRHFELTAAGRQARDSMEKLLLDYENIINEARDQATLKRGVVMLAALPSLCSSTIPPVLRRYQERYPGIDIRLRDVVANRIEALVRTGEVDFGISVRARLDDDLQFSPLTHDQLCVFLPAGHPLGTQAEIGLKELSGLPMILTGRDSSVRAQVERMFYDQGLILKSVLEANYMSTVVALVRQGLGLTLLPCSAYAGELDLRCVPLTGKEAQREIGIISRSSHTVSPAAAKLIEELQKGL